MRNQSACPAIQIQVTERVLRLVTTFVLQKSNSVTAETLLDQVESDRRKTLGYFLSELRKRADLDQHFDSTLAEFLSHRNTLVHHLSDLPGWDTETLGGIYVGRKFINELIAMNSKSLKSFQGS
jgi:hypothetical protein